MIYSFQYAVLTWAWSLWNYFVVSQMFSKVFADTVSIADLVTGLAAAAVSIMGGYGLFLKVKADAKKISLAAEIAMKEKEAEIERKDKELAYKLKKSDAEAEENLKEMVLDNYKKLSSSYEISLSNMQVSIDQSQKHIERLESSIEVISQSLENVQRENVLLRKHIAEVVFILDEYLKTLPQKDPKLVELMERSGQLLDK